MAHYCCCLIMESCQDCAQPGWPWLLWLGNPGQWWAWSRRSSSSYVNQALDFSILSHYTGANISAKRKAWLFILFSHLNVFRAHFLISQSTTNESDDVGKMTVYTTHDIALPFRKWSTAIWDLSLSLTLSVMFNLSTFFGPEQYLHQMTFSNTLPGT